MLHDFITHMKKKENLIAKHSGSTYRDNIDSKDSNLVPWDTMNFHLGFSRDMILQIK
jgi:hypothetical protein